MALKFVFDYFSCFLEYCLDIVTKGASTRDKDSAQVANKLSKGRLIDEGKGEVIFDKEVKN